MKRNLIVIIASSVAFGIIGYFVGTAISNVSHQKQLQDIRSAWYKAAIAEEEFCAKLYTNFLLEEDHNNPTMASIWVQGIQVGTSHALESMNQVAIAFGENPIVLSDIKTIQERIENIAIDMIKNGEVGNNN